MLEFIIVMIIIGVLTSLALPRMFDMVENSRKSEAFVFIASIRSALERHYLMSNGSYAPCDNGEMLGLEDPGLTPNAHFDYRVETDATNYLIFC